MHYIIIVIPLVIIVVYQFYIFNDTKNKLKILNTIFSENSSNYQLKSEIMLDQVSIANEQGLKELLQAIGKNEKDYYKTIFSNTLEKDIEYFDVDKVRKELYNYFKNEVKILHKHQNPILSEIVNSINAYLDVNKSGVSDFHLLKDIVDRNCDAQEEEIDTQIPIPLYSGLVGTMIGIIVGIGFLVLSGGLNDLLNSSKSTNGAEGVEALLGGVALAMIASSIGIILTTYSSLKVKDTKAKLEKNKHVFLSWIQAKLLPNLTNDIAKTLEKMSQNLMSFNGTFSTNTNELGRILSQVNDSYRLQSQLFNAVKQIADKDVSVKNLQLYNALKNSSEEIGTLAEYLNNSNKYLSNVKALNEKLDKHENRTKAIEEMSSFFKTEIVQVEARKAAINKSVSQVDDVLLEALTKLKDHANDQMEQLKITTSKQNDFLLQHSNQINTILAELKKMGDVKDSIYKFEQATNNQNAKLDKLTHAIYELAKSKSEGVETIDIFPQSIPWQKRLIWWGGSSLGLFLLLSIIIANWNSIADFINIFQF